MTERNEHHTFKADEIPCQEISDPAVLSKTPLVSVKMITYNHEPFIAQAIEGVLMQKTDFPIELIIGEDCSTDRTREIVVDYQKKHPDIIRVIISDKNVGMHKNGQRSEKVCRGKYIAYCEGDDYWIEPLKLQKQVDFLEANPDYGMVHSDVDTLDIATGQRIRNCRQSLNVACGDDDPDLSWWILSGTYPIWTCTVCARKVLLDDVYAADPAVFQKNRFQMGDLPLWFELSRLARVHYIDESLATYCILAESASRSRDIQRKLRFFLSGRDVRLYYIDKYSCPPGMREKILEARNRTLLNIAYEARDFQVANDATIELRKLRVELTFYERMQLFGSHPFGGVLFRPLILSKRLLMKIGHRLRRLLCCGRTRAVSALCKRDH